MVSVGTVAFCLMVFETVLFYRFIVPDVARTMRSKTHNLGRDLGVHDLLALHEPTRATLSSILGSVNDREAEYVTRLNRQTYVAAAAIVLLPLGITLALFWFSSDLRRSVDRTLLFDVALTLLPLLLFQYVFYRFGQSWQYTSDEEHASNLVRVYDPDGSIRRCHSPP